MSTARPSRKRQAAPADTDSPRRTSKTAPADADSPGRAAADSGGAQSYDTVALVLQGGGALGPTRPGVPGPARGRHPPQLGGGHFHRFDQRRHHRRLARGRARGAAARVLGDDLPADRLRRPALGRYAGRHVRGHSVRLRLAGHERPAVRLPCAGVRSAWFLQAALSAALPVAWAGAASTSFYDTSALADTLRQFVDFDLLNAGRCAPASAWSTCGPATSPISTAARTGWAPSTSWPPAHCRRASRPWKSMASITGTGAWCPTPRWPRWWARRTCATRWPSRWTCGRRAAACPPRWKKWPSGRRTSSIPAGPAW